MSIQPAQRRRHAPAVHPAGSTEGRAGGRVCRRSRSDRVFPPDRSALPGPHQDRIATGRRCRRRGDQLVPGGQAGALPPRNQTGRSPNSWSPAPGIPPPRAGGPNPHPRDWASRRALVPGAMPGTAPPSPSGSSSRSPPMPGFARPCMAPRTRCTDYRQWRCARLPRRARIVYAVQAPVPAPAATGHEGDLH